MANTQAMNPKKDLILATAKKLFVEQGVGGTTIARIASEAGIAKGSVYSYFESKQAIVLALLQAFFEKSQVFLDSLIESTETQGLALINAYIVHELDIIDDDKTLHQVLMKDDSMVMDDDLLDFVQHCRAEYHRSQTILVRKAFGNLDEKWMMDVVTLLNGAIYEYSMYITLDDASLTSSACADIIACSMDATVTALTQSTLEPALSPALLPNFSEEPHMRHKRAIGELLASMETQAEKMGKEDQQVVKETVTLITQQLAQEVVSDVMLRALIANLGPYELIQDNRKKLADLLDVPLI